VPLIMSSIPSDEPFGIAQGQWTFPGLTRAELAEAAQSISDLIDQYGADDVGDHEPILVDYVRRLQYLQTHVIQNIWGSAAQGVPSYLLTLEGLRRALDPVLTRESAREAILKTRKLLKDLRSLEARIDALQPRTASLADMVETIESAYSTADRLPTDLESLAEAQKDIRGIADEVATNRARVIDTRDRIAEIEIELSASAEEARAVLERCQTAYSAATSVGLALAFQERSHSLSKSMWIWVGGLIVALLAGGVFGAHRLQTLADLLKEPNQAPAILYPNLLISLLSIGAPIWFAWLSTKQIGQRFKMSEDYAFKAAVSRAYEGYRREAARVDEDLEVKLLASALARLDEQPLRLVETESHGSPWQEMMNSDVVKQAVKTVPAFAEQVKEMAEKVITRKSATHTASVAEPARPAATSET
ncbi:MAG: hypothetical protein NT113_02025, partial [Hyphomicrobiales bacterium]|nr:hypothetical protein [Hyphomicrobiales bacterium]